MSNTKSNTDPRFDDKFVNGLPFAVTQRSSAAAEVSVLDGLVSKGGH